MAGRCTSRVIESIHACAGYPPTLLRSVALAVGMVMLQTLSVPGWYMYLMMWARLKRELPITSCCRSPNELALQDVRATLVVSTFS